MLKLLIGLIGLVEALYPERFISVLTKLSYDYEGDRPTPKSWIVTMARIEGIILLGVAVRSAIKADSADDSIESEESDSPSGTVDRI